LSTTTELEKNLTNNVEKNSRSVINNALIEEQAYRSKLKQLRDNLELYKKTEGEKGELKKTIEE
jgi:hypothetical protein